MVAGDAQTDLAVDFEAARRRQEAEGRRPQRVGRRQHDAAVVDSRGVGGRRRWAGEREVPVVEVGVGDRGCGKVWRGRGGEFGGFFEETAHGGGGGGHGC